MSRSFMKYNKFKGYNIQANIEKKIKKNQRFEGLHFNNDHLPMMKNNEPNPFLNPPEKKLLSVVFQSLNKDIIEFSFSQSISKKLTDIFSEFNIKKSTKTGEGYLINLQDYKSFTDALINSGYCEICRINNVGIELAMEEILGLNCIEFNCMKLDTEAANKNAGNNEDFENLDDEYSYNEDEDCNNSKNKKKGKKNEASKKNKTKNMHTQLERVHIEYEKMDSNSERINTLPPKLNKCLYKFQREGIEKGITRHGRLLIADEMGVGKTIQAIGLASIYRDDWPLLIICPSSLKFNWKDEIENWLEDMVQPEEIQIIATSKDELKSGKLVYIITYDLAARMELKLTLKNFQCIIADEAHLLKCSTTARNQNLTPLLQCSKRIILLTGTPIIARPMDVYALLHILRPDKFTSFLDFGSRYCGPKPNVYSQYGGGIDYTGSSNSSELNFILSNLMIRRLKKDVLSQLPPKKRQKITVECEKDTLKKLDKILAKSNKKFQTFLDKQSKLDVDGNKKQLKDDICDEDFDADPTNKTKDEKGDNKNEKDGDKKFYSFSNAYGLTGDAKIPGILSYVEYLISNDCKFLIFGHHMSVLDSIESKLTKMKVKYIRIDGTVNPKAREGRVKDFQEKSNIKVAILSITACGVGLTLTAASTVVFAELYFTPSIMTQAEDRVHRIGQENSCVNIHYLFGKGTLDELIFKTLNEKYQTVTVTLDNKKQGFTLKNEKVEVGEFYNSKGKAISIDKRIYIKPSSKDGNINVIKTFCNKSKQSEDDSLDDETLNKILEDEEEERKKYEKQPMKTIIEEKGEYAEDNDKSYHNTEKKKDDNSSNNIDDDMLLAILGDDEEDIKKEDNKNNNNVNNINRNSQDKLNNNNKNNVKQNNNSISLVNNNNKMNNIENTKSNNITSKNDNNISDDETTINELLRLYDEPDDIKDNKVKDNEKGNKKYLKVGYNINFPKYHKNQADPLDDLNHHSNNSKRNIKTNPVIKKEGQNLNEKQEESDYDDELFSLLNYSESKDQDKIDYDQMPFNNIKNNKVNNKNK